MSSIAWLDAGGGGTDANVVVEVETCSCSFIVSNAARIASSILSTAFNCKAFPGEIVVGFDIKSLVVVIPDNCSRGSAEVSSLPISESSNWIKNRNTKYLLTNSQ